MNGWTITSLLCFSAVSSLAVLVGSSLIQNSVLVKIVMFSGLCSFGYCFWRALGLDMKRNAQK